MDSWTVTYLDDAGEQQVEGRQAMSLTNATANAARDHGLESLVCVAMVEPADSVLASALAKLEALGLTSAEALAIGSPQS